MRAGRWLLAALIAFGAWHWWQQRPLQPPPGVLAPDDPVQSDASAAAAFDDRGYRIQPLADFGLTARVLARADYHLDRLAALVPTDLALGWGRMSDSAVLRAIDISQSDRFYFWSVTEFPIPRREIETHSANMHLIPAERGVARLLARVRVGEVVALQGQLVAARAPAGWTIRSSLTREDTGPGACEVVWVQAIGIVR